MPYIKNEQRTASALPIDTSSAGTINYGISKALWAYFNENPSYSRINEIIGVLECIKIEFYRRQAAPYEDKKIIENGDI